MCRYKAAAWLCRCAHEPSFGADVLTAASYSLFSPLAHGSSQNGNWPPTAPIKLARGTQKNNEKKKINTAQYIPRVDVQNE
jgi:hypothetical protein